MPIPTPLPGLVIRYSYLWHRDWIKGQDEGRKDRPCAIVVAMTDNSPGKTRVLVLPITHSQPENAAHAIEIPAAVKRHLQLDDQRSWILIDEWNEFGWPGPDLRHITGSAGSFAFGMLPPRLFADIRNRFIALYESGLARRVQRVQ